MAFYDIDLENQVEKNHILRKINKTINFSSLSYRINDLKTEVGRHSYGLDFGLKSLFLQFYFDLSDRQMEEQ